MKSMAELTRHYQIARSLAKEGNDKNIPLIVDNINEISNHCKELYFHLSVIDQAKCKVQYESLDHIIEILLQKGLSNSYINAFFGFQPASILSPSFADIMSGNVDAEKLPSIVEDTIEKVPPKEVKVPPIVEEKPVEMESNKIVNDFDPITKSNSNSFTPEHLSEFIGQEKYVKRIMNEIQAAKKQGLKHIDYILLFGNRGLGKSTLMKLTAKEMGVQFELIDASRFGNDAKAQKNLQKFWKRISRENIPVVIAFDELHALSNSIQTSLLTILQDREFTYMDDNGVNHTLPLPEFTFIGATTDAQDVLPTIKDRCNNLTFYLEDYSREDLSKIFLNKFASQDMQVDAEVLKICIDRCRSSIREVNAFVKGLRTKAVILDSKIITTEMALEYFKDIDRDPIGLNSKEIEILNQLLNEPTGKLSKDTIAERVHLDVKVYAKEFEPYLVKIGFLNIASGGRMLTQEAINYLKKDDLNETITESQEKETIE